MSGHQLAVLGDPVAHSLSPQLHAQFARDAGIELTYRRLHTPASALSDRIEELVAAGYRGANLTLPLKSLLLQSTSFAIDISERARRASAINTLRFDAHTIVADNTDGIGLARDLARLSCAITDQHVIVIGAGGAARGILPELLAQAPASLRIANRTRARAVELLLANDQRESSAMSLASLPDQRCDVLINAGSFGHRGECPHLPQPLDRPAIAYDLSYGEAAQPFTAAAKDAGFKVFDGLGMLVEQGAESFACWFDMQPPTAAAQVALRALVNAPHNRQK